MSIGLYGKALTAGLGSAATAAITALQDSNVFGWEWVTIIGSFLVGFAAVAFVDNKTTGAGKYLKLIVTALIAGAAWLSTALVDGNGISHEEYIGALVAALTAFKAWATSDATVSDELRGVEGVADGGVRPSDL